MKPGEHFEHSDLIDFLEGEAPRERAQEIEAHLRTCGTCRAYVDSLGRTFTALAGDKVPELSPGYWAYFERRVRERAKPEKRKSLVLLWLPGVAAAAALVMLFWWLPEPRLPETDPLDVFLADLSTNEIIESLPGGPAVSLMLIEPDPDEMVRIEDYLTQTTDIYDLVEQLSEREREIFASRLKQSMKESDNTSGVTTGSAGKGC